MSSNIRIAFFSHSSALAGAERCLLELAQQLVADAGWKCLVITPSAGPLLDLLTAASVETHVVNLPWWTFYGGKNDSESLKSKREELSTASARVIKEILPVLEAFNPDIIVSNTVVFPWGSLAAYLIDKPHVWFVHEFFSAGHLENRNTIANDVLKASTRVIACSETVRNHFFPELEDNRVCVVYPSPYVTETEESGKNFSREGARLAIIGSIQAEKGQFDAVFAVHQLLGEGYAVELTLTGYQDALYADAITKYIEGNGLSHAIKINEFTPDPLDALRTADIAISCSRHEAFGRGIVEAMLLGKTVVFPETGGPTEYLRDGVTGFSYTPGNHYELSCQIKSILDNPDHAREIAQRAQKYARDQFAQATYAEKIKPILLDAINEKNHRIAPPRPLMLALESHLRSLAETNASLQHAVAEATADRVEKSEMLVTAQNEAQQLKEDMRVVLEASARKDHQLQSVSATIQFKNTQISRLERELALLNDNSQKAAHAYEDEITELRARLSSRQELALLNENSQRMAHAYENQITELRTKLSSMQMDLEFIRCNAADRSLINKIRDGFAVLRAWVGHGVSPRATYEILASQYFDRAYYLQNNPDVRISGMPPEVHYLLHGRSEGRDAGPFSHALVADDQTRNS